MCVCVLSKIKEPYNRTKTICIFLLRKGLQNLYIGLGHYCMFDTCPSFLFMVPHLIEDVHT